MILRIIFWLIMLYFMYRFIFNFVIPLVITGRKINAQVKGMKDQMRQFEGNQKPSHDASEKAQNKNNDKGEYIDFEEVK